MTAAAQTSPETPTTPETTPTSTEGVAASQERPGAPEARDPDAVARSEEAKGYRLRLRETETERDALRERVEGYERREVESIARGLGAAVPADVWTLVSLDDLRVDGVLDADAAKEHVGAILRERPTWREPLGDLGAGPRPSPTATRDLGLSHLLKRGR